MTKQKDTMKETTMEELFSYWRMMIRYQVKPSTYACYCTVIQKHILPDIGNLPLRHLGNEHLKRFLRKKEEQQLSCNTVRLIVFLLKSMIKSGEESGCVTKETLHYLMPKSGGIAARIMEEDQFDVLLKRLLQTSNDFELGLLLSLCTGIRVGELCGIQWRDIELHAGILRIRRTVSRIHNPELIFGKANGVPKTIVHIGTPKTGTSTRDIPLPDFLVLKLMEWEKEAGKFLLSGEVKCMEPRGVQRRFKNFLKKLEIPYVNIHSLRHSFASNWIENGFDTKALSEILGHSSVKITLDIYVHSSMSQKKNYMNQLLKRGEKLNCTNV